MGFLTGRAGAAKKSGSASASTLFKKNRQGFSVIQLPRGIAPFLSVPAYSGEKHDQ